MKGAYCYLPILKAREGSFSAIRSLSPAARSRLSPLFDIPKPRVGHAKDDAGYLLKKVNGIVSCWPSERPVYLDAHDFELNFRVNDELPVAFVAGRLRSNGFKPIPVTGTVPERGREYVREIGKVAGRIGSGLCIRVEREEIEDSEALQAALFETIDDLGASIAHLDLLLDLGYVGADEPAQLANVVRNALGIAFNTLSFRNVAVAGGSVPDELGKKDNGKVRRESRIELFTWSILQESFNAALAFSDFGVISPRYVKPGRPVNVPARIRYTTPTEHIFLRTLRSGHHELCEQLLAMEDFHGDAYSAGDQRMALVAAHGRAGSGTPGLWIAGDLNHHLELVSAQTWIALENSGNANRFLLPDPQPYPWLQPALTGR
jgi:T4 beta protein